MVRAKKRRSKCHDAQLLEMLSGCRADDPEQRRIALLKSWLASEDSGRIDKEAEEAVKLIRATADHLNGTSRDRRMAMCITAVYAKRIEGPEADSKLLEALRAAGVDNWEGYSEAVSNFEKKDKG